jgi:hypothetical protein
MVKISDIHKHPNPGNLENLENPDSHDGMWEDTKNARMDS